jgi:hypothetical protein
MIGRQGLHLSEYDLKNAFGAFGYVVDEGQIDEIFTKNNGYAEQLLTCLGSHEIHSFDNSGYEGATHLHDFNKELPITFKDQYTTVLDGGSLEHVFNFPVAIKNCMEMVGVGGHYLGIAPANNFMGHGFYQFSPEAYFNIFTPENGFELINVIAFEDRPKATWYSVRNPRDVRSRITLINNVPVYLLVVAKKFMRTIIFETAPQQSDYVAIWHQNNASSNGTSISTAWQSSKQVSPLDFVKRSIPVPLKNLIRKALGNSSLGFDPRFFQPLDPTANKKPPNKSLQRAS